MTTTETTIALRCPICGSLTPLTGQAANEGEIATFRAKVQELASVDAKIRTHGTTGKRNFRSHGGWQSRNDFNDKLQFARNFVRQFGPVAGFHFTRDLEIPPKLRKELGVW